MVQIDSNSPPLPATDTAQPLIRPARLQDVERLTDVLTTSFYDCSGWRYWVYPFIRLGIQEDLKQRLKAQSPRYACLMAMSSAGATPADGPAIAGTVEASLRQPWPWQGDRHIYISNLAVGQSFRRQGIASALLQSCEQLAQQWRIYDLRLHVMEDNLAAQALYRKAGFGVFQTEDTPASWIGLQARRLLLRKTITPPAPWP
ncbi:GNAT family N-acetyltransferase [Nodosilinea sp. LEGE 06152]|uniref:GNAT family N-acetyltransferase n=1 Tax=Nodosilinea sp. LEGE 06152 TaxID=2777966 RepID=UPI0018827D4C|nr:GNAT family N-acetyltransferase [Nodosilinea sp. LEGE 06152]MBE9158471.1 GNAT family N-acetyltransferase [Nodosilinea sp. LEGE 06152]MBE9160413.1 GNAT family N-acetyltransferase [Nodosilinea sp. LEGE 06152]